VGVFFFGFFVLFFFKKKELKTKKESSILSASSNMLLSDYDLPWNPSRIYEEIGVRPRTKGIYIYSSAHKIYRYKSMDYPPLIQSWIISSGFISVDVT
jgi:hypothetical protein